MRILVHDYVGHPFQVQLSRRLAAEGHDVLHVFCGSFQSPRGAMQRREGDPVGFDVQCISLDKPIPKNGYVQRFRLEAQYGKRLVEVCQHYGPDVVISGNTPSIPQNRLAKYCEQNRIRHVFWVQDIYGLAAYKLLKRRVPVLGGLVGRYFIGLDRQSARMSDELVVITEDFVPIFQDWGVDRQNLHVIHNWAVREELPIRPRENDWASRYELDSGPRFVYTGTLAMKHNPALLLALAQLLDERGAGQLMVVSEGSGAEWLQEQAQSLDVKSLKIAGFQPFEVMADVLGSADVLVAVLEPDAGVFSVPSKVLSYLCAGRAILAAMPLENLAARILIENRAGTVVAPSDLDGFCSAAQELIDSTELRIECGKAAREYADEHFDIDKIVKRFSAVLRG